jgi:hypothetical protein
MRSRSFDRVRGPLVLLALTSIVACSETNNEARRAPLPSDPLSAQEPNRVPTTIEMRPMRVVLAPGETQRFEARVLDQDGRRMDAPIRWEATGGTIDQSGRYTAGSRPGKFGARARSGDLVVTAEIRIVDAPPPGSGAIILGAWGCSQVSREWRGFTRHPAPFTTWTGLDYGGGALTNWHAGLFRLGGYWESFQGQLDRHPGTTDVYAEICIRDSEVRAGTPFAKMGEEVFREIRRIVGPQVRVWATGMVDWEGEVCLNAGPQGAEVAGRVADHVVALGLARRGPTLPPWKPSELESDSCHPNQAGQDRAAMQIAEFILRSR